MIPTPQQANAALLEQLLLLRWEDHACKVSVSPITLDALEASDASAPAFHGVVRLTGEGRCCERCGVVESIVTPLEQALGATNTRLCLPNLIGRFGPAVPKEYRLMYGGTGAADDGQSTSMPQHNVPDPVAAAAVGTSA